MLLLFSLVSLSLKAQPPSRALNYPCGNDYFGGGIGIQTNSTQYYGLNTNGEQEIYTCFPVDISSLVAITAPDPQNNNSPTVFNNYNCPNTCVRWRVSRVQNGTEIVLLETDCSLAPTPYFSNTPIFTPNQPGRYRFDLGFREDLDFNGSYETDFGYQQEPIWVNVISANAQFTPVFNCTNRTVTFNTQGFTNFIHPPFDPNDPNPTQPTVTWTFGYGNPVVTNVCTSTVNNNCNTVTHTFPANGTYTVRCTVNTQLCGTAIFQQNIVIATAPTANITVNNTTQCTGAVTTLFSNASGGVPPYTYQWTPNNGTLSSTTVANPTLTVGNPGSTTYQVIVTDSRGCSVTRTRTITSTTCCTGTYAFGNITSTQLLNTLYNNGSGPLQAVDYFANRVKVNVQLIFNGDLSLSGSLEFRDCPQVTFAPPARILTSLNSLKVINSKLFSCGNTMWQGIRVNNSDGEVWVSGNAEIRDAEYAILSTNGGNMNLQNAFLKNNWVAIRLDGYPDNFFSVKSTRFDAPQIKATSLNNFSPAATMGQIGIELNNVQNNTFPLQIGSYSPPFFPDGNENFFTNLYCGIRSVNSRFKFANNRFSIPQSVPSGNAPGYYGICVSSQSPGSMSGQFFTNYETLSDDLNAPIANYFELGRMGLVHSGIANVTIRRSEFRSLNQEFVNLHNAADRNITIEDNLFMSPYTRNGITINGCSNSNVNIVDNNMSMFNGTANPINDATIAIILTVYNANSNGRRIIVENNSIRQTHTGIQSFFVNNALIQDNSIYLWPRPFGSTPANSQWNGIFSIADNGSNFDRNFITVEPLSPSVQYTYPVYTPNASATGKLIGIHYYFEAGTINAGCDSIVNMHWAAAATGGNTNGIVMYRNAFRNNRNGVAIYNQGFIGNQGGVWGTISWSNQNRWFNNDFALGVFSATGSNQTWRFRDADIGTPRNPILSACNNVQNQLFQFRDQSASYFGAVCATTNIETTDCGPVYNTRSGGAAVLQDVSWFERVAQDSLKFTEFEEQFKSYNRIQLFAYLNENRHLLDSSATLTDFVRQNEQSDFAKLILLNRDVTATNDTVYARFYAQENDKLHPQSLHEQNLHKVNQLHLKYFSIGKFAMSKADTTDLAFIANQCAIVGGPAVFQARAMMGVITNDVRRAYNDNCSEAKRSNKTDNISSIKAKGYDFKCYPTVLSKGKEFIIESSLAGEISVFNPLGEQIMTSQFSSGMNTTGFPVNISSGYYLYTARMSTGELETGKIIIVK